MERLNNEWLTDGLIDFEYKKYILLAYFKNVRSSFNKVELYPFLSDLVMHYQNLNELKTGKEQLNNNFPKSLQGIDAKRLKLVYKQLMADDEIMKELEDIVAYAIPLFKNSLEEGKEIYEFVEKSCEISPIGLLPLYNEEGYFFLSNADAEMTVHRYQMMRLTNPNQSFRGINTTFITKIKKGIGNTLENMKIDLVRRFNDLPNPATYLIESKLKFPYTATLVPIAKRLLIKHIATT